MHPLLTYSFTNILYIYDLLGMKSVAATVTHNDTNVILSSSCTCVCCDTTVMAVCRDCCGYCM